eukprot:Rmarinus@m.9228
MLVSPNVRIQPILGAEIGKRNRKCGSKHVQKVSLTKVWDQIGLIPCCSGQLDTKTLYGPRRTVEGANRWSETERLTCTARRSRSQPPRQSKRAVQMNWTQTRKLISVCLVAQ